jgi:hypothetical protein
MNIFDINAQQSKILGTTGGIHGVDADGFLIALLTKKFLINICRLFKYA